MKLMLYTHLGPQSDSDDHQVVAKFSHYKLITPFNLGLTLSLKLQGVVTNLKEI